ncbi:hypothetical protein IFM89_028910 [Coptis chinensis]|uniref:RRM domain-containing protein n=1 Tax=Coptis chinensis TaxID=261450 RepID=A0A835HCB4_9MAGN|nr:hypothetical protein IFM89_028910 [Coptis chinensis]
MKRRKSFLGMINTFSIETVVAFMDHGVPAADKKDICRRPRGFGFITYDSEDAIEKVIFKTFHALNGNMVEVKRDAPKELSPRPSRSLLRGYNYSLSRVNSFLNGYTQGYNPNSIGNYGVRMDGRFSPGLSPSYGGNTNFSTSLAINQKKLDINLFVNLFRAGMNKSNDNDWFRISAANPEGTKWTGKCWYVHNLLKYEFDIPVTYLTTAPELLMEKLTRCIEEERFASQFILNHCGRKTGMWNVLFSNAI